MTEIATIDRTELATVGPPSGSLALRPDQVEWTDLQRAAFAQIGIDKAPATDQAVFLHVCQRTRLDPYNREIYMIKRKDRGEEKWTIQTGIDGFRSRAEEHPQYAGTLDPEWCGPDGVWRDSWLDNKPPVMARVRVLRHDRANPISLAVRFVEFAAAYDGSFTGQWKTKPAHMIQKVAEAASLRKAFPKTFAGLHVEEEFARDDHGGHHAVDRPASAGRVTTGELTGRGPVIDAEPVDTPAGPPLAASEQTKAVADLFREAELGDRKDAAARQQLTTLLLRREVDTSAGLTAADADAIVEALTAVKNAGHADGLAGAAADLLNEDDLRREAAAQAPADVVDAEPIEDGQS